MCSAAAAPRTQEPARSLGQSQHLGSSQPGWAGLRRSCRWLRGEGRKLFGPDEPEDPEEGEAITQRLPPLKSSFPSTDPEGKLGVPGRAQPGAEPGAVESPAGSPHC